MAQDTKSPWLMMGLNQYTVPQLGPMLAMNEGLDYSAPSPIMRDEMADDLRSSASPLQTKAFEAAQKRILRAPAAAQAVRSEGPSFGDDPNSGDVSQAFKDLMADRAKGIEGLQTELANERAREVRDISYAPLLNAVDTWTGSKFSQSYVPPQEEAKKAAMVEKLREAVDRQKGALSDDQINYLRLKADERARLDANEARREQNQMMREMSRDKTGLAEQRLSLATDRAKSQQYGVFDNDSTIKAFGKSQALIRRGTHSLDNPPGGKVTPQLLKEVSNEIANALAGGQSAVDDRHKGEYATAMTTIAQYQQFLTNNPQQATSPQIVNHLKEQLRRIDESFSENMADRARILGEGRQFTNEGLNQAVKSKMNSYGTGSQGHTAPKSNKVRVSNGRETLMIDQSDLVAAQADGFKVM